MSPSLWVSFCELVAGRLLWIVRYGLVGLVWSFWVGCGGSAVVGRGLWVDCWESVGLAAMGPLLWVRSCGLVSAGLSLWPRVDSWI